MQKLKAALQNRSVKTVNNCLSTLSTMLKVAVKWTVIDRIPVEVEHLKAADSTVDFYEAEDYERLVQAAEKLGPAQQLVVLLGGDAGLRMGEMIALEWSDVDLKRGLLKVQRSDWKGHVNLPKGGRPREVPLTRALASAFVRARHLRGERVLYREDGTPASQQTVRSWMSAAQKRAGLKVTGALHIFFGSLLTAASAATLVSLLSCLGKLLGILGKGRLTDGLGLLVDFRMSVVCMTSSAMSPRWPAHASSTCYPLFLVPRWQAP